MERFAPGFEAPGADEPPYLFCGNGACRDCNVLVDGLVDIPSCRVDVVPGMSVRSGEGAGEENALSRKIDGHSEGPELVCDEALVSAEQALVAEGAPRPVAVLDRALYVFIDGVRRRVRAHEIVLTIGNQDVFTGFPGAGLPGVLPLDLAERSAAHGYAPGRRVLLIGPGSRVEPLSVRLRDLGADVVNGERLRSVSGDVRVERATLADGTSVRVDTVAGSHRREPALAVAKALGCRTRYDRELRHDILEVDERGRTSVPGVRAVVR